MPDQTEPSTTTIFLGRLFDPRSALTHEAVAVRDGRITAVGPAAEVTAAAAPKHVVDLRDRGMVVPGFVDAHTHLQTGARVLGLNVGVHTPPTRSIEDIIATLRRADEERPGTGWLEGQGNLGQSQRLADRRYPTRYELDAVSTTRPVVVRFGVHVWSLSSRALALLGIDRDTVLPSPARVECDESGEPTGVVNDLFIVRHKLPHLSLPEPSDDSFEEALVSAANTYFTARGVTTIGEMTDGLAELGVVRRRIVDGSIALRLKLYALGRDSVEAVEAGTFADVLGLDAPEVADRLVLGGIKLMGDGGVSAREAAVWEAYPDRPGYTGQLGLAEGDVERTVQLAEERGFQLLVHTAGDRAMDFVLDAFERAGQKLGGGDGTPAWTHRHRMEHLGNVFATRERIARSRDLGIMPVANIGFLHGIGDSMRGVVGEGFESAPMYPLKTILAHGFPAAGASDFAGGLPEISDPLFLMRVMRERKTFAGLTLSPEESLSPVEALRAVTCDAAVAMEMEHLVGGFRAGGLADFAVLSGDPLTAEPEHLTDGTVRVLETWLGGKQVWQHDEA